MKTMTQIFSAQILLMSLMALSTATAFAGEAGDRASNHAHTKIVRDRLASSSSSTVVTPADVNTARAESTDCASHN